jgi:endoglucanase
VLLIVEDYCMYLYGINFGGYLSQAKLTDSHLNTFITKKDVKRVKDWGFNVIRLPFDYILFEDENGVEYIDRVIQWAAEYSLYIILDLHVTPGHTFDINKKHENDIWDENSENRERFLKFWEFLSERYRTSQKVIYEIMNEPTAPEPDMWNELAQEAINTIRTKDNQHQIIVESNMWGNCSEFRHLKKFNDDKIIYSFHNYDPILITHYLAEWIPIYQYEIYTEHIKYPGKPKRIEEGLKKIKEMGKEKDIEFASLFLKEKSREYNRDEMLKKMKPVLDFKEKHNVPVLCGEFGCIVKADPETRKNWTQDMVSIFKEKRISYTYWNYKNLDFGLYDFTEKYAGNPNYNNSERLDRNILKVLQSGIIIN